MLEEINLDVKMEKFIKQRSLKESKNKNLRVRTPENDLNHKKIALERISFHIISIWCEK